MDPSVGTNVVDDQGVQSANGSITVSPSEGSIDNDRDIQEAGVAPQLVPVSSSHLIGQQHACDDPYKLQQHQQQQLQHQQWQQQQDLHQQQQLRPGQVEEAHIGKSQQESRSIDAGGQSIQPCDVMSNEHEGSGGLQVVPQEQEIDVNNAKLAGEDNAILPADARSQEHSVTEEIVDDNQQQCATTSSEQVSIACTSSEQSSMTWSASEQSATTSSASVQHATTAASQQYTTTASASGQSGASNEQTSITSSALTLSTATWSTLDQSSTTCPTTSNTGSSKQPVYSESFILYNMLKGTDSRTANCNNQSEIIPNSNQNETRYNNTQQGISNMTLTPAPAAVSTEINDSAMSSVQDTNNWCCYECKLCSQTFENRKSWKCHTMDEHGMFPYECRYCSERYEHKSDAKEHQRLHKSRRKVTVQSQESELSSLQEVAKTAEDHLCNQNKPLEMTVQESGEVTRHKKDEVNSTAQNADKILIIRKKKMGCKTKASIRQQKKKKNVVVVSVLDVLKSDAEKLKQQQKGGATGALLSIVDQIRTSTEQGEEDDTENGKALDVLKGNYRLRGGRKSLPDTKDDDDDENDTPDDEQDVDDDDDELYEAEETKSASPVRHKRKKPKHKKHSKGGKIHKCKICHRVLSSNKVKIYHERGHPYAIECTVCHWAFQNKFDCDDHEIGHMKGLWTCRLCSEVFRDPQLFDKHRKIHHQQEKDSQHFSCQYCSKVVKSKKSLEVHLRLHTGEKPYQCSFCDKRYRHYESWNYHENKHKGTLKQHVCQFCGKAFGGKYGLQVHERIHTGEKPFKCDHCHLAFSSNEKLKVHKDRISGMAYVCQFCGKEFFTKANLNQHEMIHKGVKPHKCKSCEASFTSVTSLKYHVRTVHTGERYPCQFCNKQCKSKGQLTSHLRSHTDERPFKCKFCNKCFRNSNTLKTHEQGIHLGFRYTCEICKKDFSQRTALRTHDKLVHQGIKWKDLVLQRKINRERRLAQDGTKQDGATTVDVKFAPAGEPGDNASTDGELKATQIPTSEQNMLEPSPSGHHEAAMQEAVRQMNKQPLKLYQHRMVYPIHLEQPTDTSQQVDHPGIDPHLHSRPASHPNLTIPGSLPPIPVSVSVTNDPHCVDVAYQLATLASNARHLLHMRQGHPDDGTLQVHVPGVTPGDTGVVDVVFPSDSGAPMYQTL